MIGLKKVAVYCPHTMLGAWESGEALGYDVVYVVIAGGGSRFTPQQLKAAISLSTMGITVSIAQGSDGFRQIFGYDKLHLCPICERALGFREQE